MPTYNPLGFSVQLQAWDPKRKLRPYDKETFESNPSFRHPEEKLSEAYFEGRKGVDFLDRGCAPFFLVNAGQDLFYENNSGTTDDGKDSKPQTVLEEDDDDRVDTGGNPAQSPQVPTQLPSREAASVPATGASDFDSSPLSALPSDFGSSPPIFHTKHVGAGSDQSPANRSLRDKQHTPDTASTTFREPIKTSVPFQIQTTMTAKSFMPSLYADKKQDICINIFYNGELMSSRCFSAAAFHQHLLLSGGKLVANFSGKRVSKDKEIPFSIMPLKSRPVGQHSHTADAEPRWTRAEQQWNRVNSMLLLEEAGKWGTSGKFDMFPSPIGEYLKSVSKLAAPQELKEFRTSVGGRTIGIVDVVVALGTSKVMGGDKQLPCETEPTRKVPKLTVRKQKAVEAEPEDRLQKHTTQSLAETNGGGSAASIPAAEVPELPSQLSTNILLINQFFATRKTKPPVRNSILREEGGFEIETILKPPPTGGQEARKQSTWKHGLFESQAEVSPPKRQKVDEAAVPGLSDNPVSTVNVATSCFGESTSTNERPIRIRTPKIHFDDIVTTTPRGTRAQDQHANQSPTPTRDVRNEIRDQRQDSSPNVGTDEIFGLDGSTSTRKAKASKPPVTPLREGNSQAKAATGANNSQAQNKKGVQSPVSQPTNTAIQSAAARPPRDGRWGISAREVRKLEDALTPKEATEHALTSTTSSLANTRLVRSTVNKSQQLPAPSAPPRVAVTDSSTPRIKARLDGKKLIIEGLNFSDWKKMNLNPKPKSGPVPFSSNERRSTMIPGSFSGNPGQSPSIQRTIQTQKSQYSPFMPGFSVQPNLGSSPMLERSLVLGFGNRPSNAATTDNTSPKYWTGGSSLSAAQKINGQRTVENQQHFEELLKMRASQHAELSFTGSPSQKNDNSRALPKQGMMSQKTIVAASRRPSTNSSNALPRSPLLPPQRILGPSEMERAAAASETEETPTLQRKGRRPAPLVIQTETTSRSYHVTHGRKGPTPKSGTFPTLPSPRTPDVTSFPTFEARLAGASPSVSARRLSGPNGLPLLQPARSPPLQGDPTKLGSTLRKQSRAGASPLSSSPMRSSPIRPPTMRTAQMFGSSPPMGPPPPRITPSLQQRARNSLDTSTPPPRMNITPVGAVRKTARTESQQNAFDAVDTTPQPKPAFLHSSPTMAKSTRRAKASATPGPIPKVPLIEKIDDYTNSVIGLAGKESFSAWHGIMDDDNSPAATRTTRTEKHGVFRASSILMGVRYVLGVPPATVLSEAEIELPFRDMSGNGGKASTEVENPKTPQQKKSKRAKPSQTRPKRATPKPATPENPEADHVMDDDEQLDALLRELSQDFT